MNLPADGPVRLSTQSLMAGSVAAQGVVAAPLDAADVQRLTGAALARLALTPAQRTVLQALTVRLADLPGQQLGAYQDGAILIDSDAAGHGWFVDGTPGDDAEFAVGALVLRAGSGPAEGRIDLLSVLAHEFGHAAGLDHHDVGLMADRLEAGTRTLAAPPPLDQRPASVVGLADPFAWSGAVPAPNPLPVAPSPLIDWGVKRSDRTARPVAGAAERPWQHRLVDAKTAPGLALNASIRLHADGGVKPATSLLGSR